MKTSRGKTLANRIIDLRARCHFTPLEVVQDSDMPSFRLVEIEAGAEPTYSEIKSIAKGFCMDLSEFFDEVTE